MLKNRGFEGNVWKETFNNEEYNEISVPEHWVAFWKEGEEIPYDPANEEGYRRPECKVITKVEPFLDPPRIAEGHKAWQCFTFFGIHDAGLYQQVSVTPGNKYKFSAKTHAWSSQDDNAHTSIQDDNISQMVGIDPTGGTNPWSNTVIWGNVKHLYDEFGTVETPEIEAKNDTVTVFIRSVVKWRYKHNDVHWDDTKLEEVTQEYSGKLSLDEVITLLKNNWPEEAPVPPVLEEYRLYSQRDPEWADDEMGKSGKTLGQIGCVITSIAMLISNKYPNITPKELNASLNRVDGYTDTGALWWKKVEDVVPDIKFTMYHKWVKVAADVELVKQELAKHPVILAVDFDPYDTDWDNHFVLATKLVGEDIEIYDPWDGKVHCLLERYGKEGWDLARAIYALAVYEWDEDVIHTPWENNPQRVSLHIQGPFTDKVKEFIRALKPSVVKYIGTNFDWAKLIWEQSPETLVVMRRHVNSDAGYLHDPNGPRAFVDLFRDELEAIKDYPQVKNGQLLIESINEVMAGSDIPKAVEFDLEVIEELPNYVRPVVATIPVGNPETYELPELLPLARKIEEVDGFFGYHNYYPAWQGNSMIEEKWDSYAGRYEMMDNYFVQNGIHINWMFGETGCIALEPSGHMPPKEGFKHPNALDNNLDRFIADMKYMRDRIAQNPRILGATIFTICGWDWEYFHLHDSEIDKFIQAFK